MHYFFASESLGEQANLLSQIAEVLGRDEPIEAYRKIEDLSARLRRSSRSGILILLAADQRDLALLSADVEIYLEADIILLVANDEDDTIAAAHALRPRYLGNADCDLEQIVPVLRKLVRKREHRL